MSNVIPFKKEEDLIYITGVDGEPDIVGVRTGFGSIELAPDLRGIMVDGNWITRKEFVAFILATDIWHDLKEIIKNENI